MFAENLKYLREKNNMEQLELAEKLGRKSSSSISEWEKGKYTPKLKTLNEIAKLFKVDIDDLMNIDLSLELRNSSIEALYNQLEKPRQQKVYSYAEHQLDEQNKVVELPNRKAPLLGDVAANPTELTYGDPVYDEEVTSNVPSGADGALTIQGDSMEDLFRNGDICFFHRQPDVENGEIAIVEIDGTGVTCKKVIKENGSIILRSLNDKYKDRKIEKESVRIIGKVLV
ncbi:LexA family transcriptional regulator [Marinilactibacillus psychrotolerans]|uniref:LexA family transcriptional regulator n=1 Tax=Marinilactibacillus psychrotolerans TaxID=191770 RepID=A0A5R9C616_9LACT|nr:XRE family transcriptional regulator [Marinilactibacillus psychrotolerans]TLQ08517.1 LexA family transcriptional regulator [Marinilactibacillus psychrotolerans]